MRIPIHIAKILLQLSQGEVIPLGKAKHAIIEELISENIIEQTGRIQKKLKDDHKNCFHKILINLNLITKLDIKYKKQSMLYIYYPTVNKKYFFGIIERETLEHVESIGVLDEWWSIADFNEANTKYIIENNIVYKLPQLTMYLVDGTSKTILYNANEELNDVVLYNLEHT
jgi:hypothetical protein